MRYNWRYRGRRVIVPRTAEIRAPFRPGQSGNALVQQMLDVLEPWRRGEDPIHTESFEGGSFSPIVVRVGRGDRVFYAQHRYHTARVVKPSPFVRPRVLPEKTNRLTIELTGTPREPMLVRAYPGGYIPPLPWQKSARFADGGIEFCRRFWSNHAFVYRDHLVMGNHQTRARSNRARAR